MFAIGPVLFLASAWAEVPLPSFRERIGLDAWEEVDQLLEAGRTTEAIERAEAFERTVTETAGLAYEIGLAYRLLDQPEKSMEHLRRSIELDPTYAAPWYEIGEMHLVAGRFHEAGEAFAHVTDLVRTGPTAKYGPQRQAEVAAHLRDPEAFEAHIREALHRGFSFREIAGLPNWKRFYADPVMHDSIEKMITVYADRSVLETLREPEGADPTP